MGERTPHLDADARGVFFGLSAIHDKRDMLRAVMEGVVFSLCDCMGIIKNMGVDPKTVYASGGGAASTLWRQMLADAFNMPVSVNNSVQGGAMGVAILAGVGSGIYPNIPDTCRRFISEKKRSEPNKESAAVYEKTYRLYENLYTALKDSFKTLADINNG